MVFCRLGSCAAPRGVRRCAAPGARRRVRARHERIGGGVNRTSRCGSDWLGAIGPLHTRLCGAGVRGARVARPAPLVPRPSQPLAARRASRSSAVARPASEAQAGGRQRHGRPEALRGRRREARRSRRGGTARTACSPNAGASRRRAAGAAADLGERAGAAQAGGRRANASAGAGRAVPSTSIEATSDTISLSTGRTAAARLAPECAAKRA